MKCQISNAFSPYSHVYYNCVIHIIARLECHGRVMSLRIVTALVYIQRSLLLCVHISGGHDAGVGVRNEPKKRNIYRIIGNERARKREMNGTW